MADTSTNNFAVLNMAAQQYEGMTSGSTRELARHMIKVSPPIEQNSVVLDNACGTGIVAQEVLLSRFSANTGVPKITCVDVAPPMIGLARDICRGMVSDYKSRIPKNVSSHPEEIVACDVMPGEELKLPDEHFTHSFTNQGILYFKDANKGASEIYRTLSTGGTAVVTSWASLGHVNIAREAQQAYKPGSTVMPFPISDEWYQAAHLKKTLELAGFKNVEVHEKAVWFAKKSVAELSGLFFAMWANFASASGFSEEEKAEFQKVLTARIGDSTEKVSRLVAGDLEGTMEELVGIKSVALVAVARK
ncbi:S-adenosyl-L-methionine-dependent methyltransferase [Phaeosphaeriaceae sp. SRC1lsM3a]|nr:S-adenosyl-L-methionine-dependent methyltransferase [Stagonospora sp. SRC1lsM3a]